jgi:hypothetical protein
MNLFSRRRNNAQPPENTFQLALPSEERNEPLSLAPISLNAEQKEILNKPVDPRVSRILQEIYEDRAAAERALKSRRIIDFPADDSGERHVVQDEQGFWRIVPGPPPVEARKLFDAI